MLWTLDQGDGCRDQRDGCCRRRVWKGLVWTLWIEVKSARSHSSVRKIMGVALFFPNLRMRFKIVRGSQISEGISRSTPLRLMLVIQLVYGLLNNVTKHLFFISFWMVYIILYWHYIGVQFVVYTCLFVGFRSNASEVFGKFLHILQLTSTSETGVQALGYYNWFLVFRNTFNLSVSCQNKFISSISK